MTTWGGRASANAELAKSAKAKPANPKLTPPTTTPRIAARPSISHVYETIAFIPEELAT